MELARIGSVVGTAMEANRHNARLRAAEKRISRRCAEQHKATRKECTPPSWGQRIDASIDPVIALAACAMLGYLLQQWL